MSEYRLIDLNIFSMSTPLLYDKGFPLETLCINPKALCGIVLEGFWEDNPRGPRNLKKPRRPICHTGVIRDNPCDPLLVSKSMPNKCNFCLALKNASMFSVCAVGEGGASAYSFFAFSGLSRIYTF